MSGLPNGRLTTFARLLENIQQKIENISHLKKGEDFSHNETHTTKSIRFPFEYDLARFLIPWVNEMGSRLTAVYTCSKHFSMVFAWSNIDYNFLQRK